MTGASVIFSPLLPWPAIWVAAALCLALLGRLWTRLLTMTVHEDLARVEGIAVERMRLAFLLLVSVMVALSMQIVGLLLTVSLLILPPATARRVASSPEQMACIATALGCVSVLVGLAASMAWDTPAGPTIVVAATVLFALTSLVAARG